jgi:hypothetical protein
MPSRRIPETWPERLAMAAVFIAVAAPVIIVVVIFVAVSSDPLGFGGTSDAPSRARRTLRRADALVPPIAREVPGVSIAGRRSFDLSCRDSDFDGKGPRVIHLFDAQPSFPAVKAGVRQAFESAGWKHILSFEPGIHGDEYVLRSQKGHRWDTYADLFSLSGTQFTLAVSTTPAVCD